MEELGFMIPLAVHEDAAPYSKTASFNCKSWSALLGDGDEKVAKYMACSCIKDKETAQADCSWEALLADLWALGSGTVDGQPVALEPDGTKWTFVLLIAKGDEECHCQEWGLPHYNSEEVCSECLANRTDHPYTDLRRGASWRLTTPLGKAAYLARCRQPLHPLLAHPMATRLLCFLDVMHMVDCKGVASWVFGGVLNTLLKEPALGANQKERLRRINQERLQWYKNNPGIIKLPRLLLHSHRQQDGWAELAGPAFKAAVTRNAARFFEHLAASFCNSDTPKHQNIRKVTSNLVGFYGVLYKAGWFLNEEELVKLATHTQDFEEHDRPDIEVDDDVMVTKVTCHGFTRSPCSAATEEGQRKETKPKEGNQLSKVKIVNRKASKKQSSGTYLMVNGKFFIALSSKQTVDHRSILAGMAKKIELGEVTTVSEAKAAIAADLHG